MSERGKIDLVVQAALKLDSKSTEWQNVLSFIQSCYACRVRDFDLEQALISLERLSDEEEAALIAWVLHVEEVRFQLRQAA